MNTNEKVMLGMIAERMEKGIAVTGIYNLLHEETQQKLKSMARDFFESHINTSMARQRGLAAVYVMLQQNSNAAPKTKVTISADVLASLLHSAAYAILLSKISGFDTVTLSSDIPLSDFLRFCLGEAGDLER